MGRLARAGGIGVALLLGLAVAVLALLLAVSYGWQRERLRGLVEEALSESLGAEVRIGALEGVLHHEAVVRDVTLRLDGRDVARLATLRVRPARLELAAGLRLTLASVVAEGLWLHAERSADGWNVAPLLGGDEGTGSAPPLPLRVTVRRLEAGGRLEVVGAGLEQIAADLELRAHDLVLPLRRFRRSWVIDEALLEGPGIVLRARGAGSARRLEGLSLDGEVDDLARLALLAPELAPRGRLALHAELSGTWSEPEAVVELTGDGLSLRGEALGKLEASVVAGVDGRVRIERLALSGGRLPLHVAAGAVLHLGPAGVVFEGVRVVAAEQALALDGGVGPAGFAGLVVDATALDLARLSRLAGLAVTVAGRADAHLELDGPFGQPRLSGRLDWREPEIGGTRFERMGLALASRDAFLEVEASLRRSGRDVARAELRLPTAGWRLAPTALLTSPRLRADVRVEELDLALLDPLVPLGVPRLRGVAAGRLAWTGGPQPRDVAVDVRVAALSVDGSAEADVEVGLADAGGGWLRIDALRVERPDLVLAAVPGGRVRVTRAGVTLEGVEVATDGASVRLAGGILPGGFAGLRVEAVDLDVARLAALAGSPLELGGRLEAELELDGALEAPALAGTLRWLDASAGGEPVDRVTLSLHTGEGSIAATGLVERAGRPLVDASLSLPQVGWRERDALLASPLFALELRARPLDLTLVEPWLPAALAEPKGSLRGSLRVRGGRPRPLVEGDLALHEGSVALPLLARTVSPIEGRVHLAEDALHVESLRAGPPEHQATLQGRVGLEAEGIGEADLVLSLTDFPLVRSKLARADASGVLTLEGPPAALRVEGDLVLDPLGIRVPEAQDPTLKEIRIRTAAAPERLREGPAGPPGFLERAAADVRVLVPEGSWIRGRGADLILEGKLHVTKRPLESTLTEGKVRVVRGSYRLHGRRFQLVRGRARFDGPLDPLLDVEAAYRVRDVTVLAFLSGRVSDPAVRLASEPPLPRDDVLAYLLFGRPSDEVAAGKQSALEGAAVQLAAGVALGEVEQVFGDSFPVDTVDVRIEEDGTLAALGVGGQLTDRIFVRYGRTLGVEPEDEVGVEIRLTPRWSLQSDVSSGGNAGADVIWRLDY